MKVSLQNHHSVLIVLPTIAFATLAYCMEKGKVMYFTVCYYSDQYMKYFM